MAGKYAGLTDKPEQRKQEHGNPPDWKIEREFKTEKEARAWEEDMHKNKGYEGSGGGPGWKYGYTYTITDKTKQ